MYTRVVEINCKPGKSRELTDTINEKVVPILKKQRGFVDETVLVSDTESTRVLGLSFWNSKEDAERYHQEQYPKIRLAAGTLSRKRGAWNAYPRGIRSASFAALQKAVTGSWLPLLRCVTVSLQARWRLRFSGDQAADSIPGAKFWTKKARLQARFLPAFAALQAALPAAIRWVVEVWTSKVPMTGSVSTKACSISRHNERSRVSHRRGSCIHAAHSLGEKPLGQCGRSSTAFPNANI
jgi:heme-degrading monooxygenase HmoA